MYLNTILINVQGQFTMLKFECLLFVYGLSPGIQYSPVTLRAKFRRHHIMIYFHVHV